MYVYIQIYSHIQCFTVSITLHSGVKNYINTIYIYTHIVLHSYFRLLHLLDQAGKRWR